MVSIGNNASATPRLVFVKAVRAQNFPAEIDKIRLETQKKNGGHKLVLKIKRGKNHSISRISSHSRQFWPDSLLSAYI